jgi:hypothetical protein
LVAACGGSGEDAVDLGPGAGEPAPAEARVEEDPGAEPGWADEVPAVAEADTPARALLQAADAASPALVAPPDSGEPPALNQTDPRHGDYEGTMAIEIAYYDYCQTFDGNLGYAGTQTYEMPVEVFLNPPAELDGRTERSPFNLIVTSQLGVEGALVLMSGQVATDQQDGRSVLIDYWDIDQDGDDFSGVLTDRWPGLVFNTISTNQLLVPCRPELGSFALSDPVAEGAGLEGTLTDDGILLEVLAQSLDREVRFRATIEVETAG